ncbi:hypothetical protein CEP51_002855 [Fusarium floridanum]|uniref:Uncharacterized protein n=1 Tax=Fusarium floridanum TaxID=1325733 RepID=A0A428S9D7_9HYPO|nr:hypothetical protein CEP51_002855 [Fusarium floridanum]
MANQADICVGIDFGTTYTGVSWNASKERSGQINIIRQWPGEAESEEKVPTVLAREQSGEKTRWGFLCKGLTEEENWRLFKLLLDPKEHKTRLANSDNGPKVPETMDQVHELVRQYLHQVYTHLRDEIPKLIRSDTAFSRQLRHKTWDSLAIDFIFSTPTTWGAPISQCFRGIVFKAGFGEKKLHRVMLGLTEAEASAVLTCQLRTVGQIHKDDVILAIDAGGGTTDLAFIKATAATANSLSLEEIHPVTGSSAGSIRIDNEFEKIIEERVKQHSETRPALPKDFSLKASQSRDFQSWKHKFKPKDYDRTCDEYFIEEVAGKDLYSHDGLGIREGRLYFTRRQLKNCFDIALREIEGLIKDALGNFEASNRRQGVARHVNYVILSGGLGSSSYVLKELTTLFSRLGNEANSCVTGSRVLGAEDHARTAVVEGLLYDRRAKGARALGEHKARANYGIIVEEPRPKDPALNENTKQYTADTTVFVTDRIRWLVKFGETIQVGKPITVEITKRLEKSDQRKWTEKIVWLKGPDSFLPETVEDGKAFGMEVLHCVDIEVRKGTKLSSRRTFMGTTAYHKCHFNLSLAVGPSGDCDVEVSENVIKLSG